MEDIPEDAHNGESTLKATKSPIEQDLEQRRRKSNHERDLRDVVISLAKALKDARDQLVVLIQYSSASLLRGNALKNSRGFCSGREKIHNREAKTTYPQGNDALPMRYGGGGSSILREQTLGNVHREHARGHIAFGVHSEFKPVPPKYYVKQPTKDLLYCSDQTRSNPYSARNGTRLGIDVDAKPNSLKINMKKGRNDLMSIKFLPRIKSPRSASKRWGPPLSSSKRQCEGNQFAATLKKEAFEIRQRIRPKGGIDPTSRA